eukprot:GHVU01209911.1.p1 GENE.GHVU01209911.1~~GHVU01209911.1.p1  ORF type:complete len:350 (-),score=48.09 GHVU01209911.1:964-2013(-)
MTTRVLIKNTFLHHDKDIPSHSRRPRTESCDAVLTGPRTPRCGDLWRECPLQYLSPIQGSDIDDWTAAGPVGLSGGSRTPPHAQSTLGSQHKPLSGLPSGTVNASTAGGFDSSTPNSPLTSQNFWALRTTSLEPAREERQASPGSLGNNGNSPEGAGGSTNGVDAETETSGSPMEAQLQQSQPPASGSSNGGSSSGNPALNPNNNTTVMLRNIPNKYTQTMLLHEVDGKDDKRDGFSGLYDFFYIPIDFRNKCNVGYAFINFITAHYASIFFEKFNGYKLNGFRSSKVCEVSWGRVQGLAANVEQYRNSAVMTVQEENYKPQIFSKGVRVEFPRADGPLPPLKLRPQRG